MAKVVSHTQVDQGAQGVFTALGKFHAAVVKV